MGSSGGGGGNPAAYTGGAPRTPPTAPTTSNYGPPPNYFNFLSGLSGRQMATPASVSAAMQAMPSQPMASPQGAGPLAPPGQGQQNPAAMRAMIAQMIARNDASRRDALDGGYFSGTNAQRQQHLRANRSYRGSQR